MYNFSTIFLSQQEFRSPERQNTENGNAPMDNQQPQDIFLHIFKNGQHLLPDKTQFHKIWWFCLNFSRIQRDKRKSDFEGRKKKKIPAFSLSLYHCFLIKQLSGPAGLNSDHIPGSEGKTPTKKGLEGGFWPMDISWSSYRKEPAWASQVTSRQLRHRCRKNIELWGIIRFIFFNK